MLLGTAGDDITMGVADTSLGLGLLRVLGGRADLGITVLGAVGVVLIAEHLAPGTPRCYYQAYKNIALLVKANR